MGLKTWLQGHGWDGARQTPAEQHTQAMQAQVEAWKARYAERGQRERDQGHQRLTQTTESEALCDEYS